MTNTMSDDRKALIERLKIAAVTAADAPTGVDVVLLADALRIAAQPSPDAAQESPSGEVYWWCPECKEELHWSRVTFSEHHDACGTRAVAKTVPAQGGECGEVAVPHALILKFAKQSEFGLQDIVDFTRAVLRWEYQRAASAGKPVVSIPYVCDGKEQPAFEAWAEAHGHEMHQHPIHYIFLDRETNIARQAWKGCLEYVQSVATSQNPPADAVSSVQDEGMVAIDEETREALNDVLADMRQRAHDMECLKSTPQVEKWLARLRKQVAALSRLASK